MSPTGQTGCRVHMNSALMQFFYNPNCCSVTKSHPALFDPVDGSIPCFPVLQYQRSCFLGNTESKDLGPESHNLKGGTSRDLRQNRWSSNSDSNHYPMTLNSLSSLSFILISADVQSKF